jgi:hypothetical protein
MIGWPDRAIGCNAIRQLPRPPVVGAKSLLPPEPFFVSTLLLTEESDSKIQEPRRWCGDGWTAQVIKNDDDDGWAVAMTKDGQAEPALIGPWTMGRDKKNPKPLDGNAFSTLVKTASEFVRRSEQQLHATLHQSITVTVGADRVTVYLDIEPDEENPSAVLSARDEGDDVLAEVRVAPSFKLNRSSAVAWAERGFAKPK